MSSNFCSLVIFLPERYTKNEKTSVAGKDEEAGCFRTLPKLI
jgi:hypothetical protein